MQKKQNRPKAGIKSKNMSFSHVHQLCQPVLKRTKREKTKAGTYCTVAVSSSGCSFGVAVGAVVSNDPV